MSGSRLGGSAAAGGGAAAAMRVVVQVPQLPRDDDLLGFLHSTTASVSKVQGARLLSQRMLDRWAYMGLESAAVLRSYCAHGAGRHTLAAPAAAARKQQTPWPAYL
jgi:hypothetical protein